MIKKEGRYYVAYVPTLGISDFGRSVDIARRNVEAAISVHIEGLIKTGNEIPGPDSSDFYISQSQVSVPANIKLAF